MYLEIAVCMALFLYYFIIGKKILTAKGDFEFKQFNISRRNALMVFYSISLLIILFISAQYGTQIVLVGNFAMPFIVGFILTRLSCNWHKSNEISKQILGDFCTQSEIAKFLKHTLKNGIGYVCNEKYVAEIIPFDVKIARWDQVFKIVGYEADGLTIPSSVICFYYENDECLCISDTDDNFSNVTKMMEKKFPMISKEWPNHVFNAAGRAVTLYTYENQVY